MTVGQRILRARSAAGLSLRELAEAVGVSHTAIANYEAGRDNPSSGTLLKLATALNVQLEYFFRPARVDLGQVVPVYRKRSSLTETGERQTLARVLGWLEQYLTVEDVLAIDRHRFQQPDGFPFVIAQLADVEKAAVALREKWNLGLDPIENLTELLEDKGIKVGLVEADDDFDACTFSVGPGDLLRFVAVKQGLPGDRQRFNLAHELGHSLLVVADDVDVEKAAHRFAGAFLVPEPTVIDELGVKRHSLDLRELQLLKHKYGLSMQAWMYRAKDLGIITQRTFGTLFGAFKKRGWDKVEPGKQYPAETPTRMERLVRRALAEDLISEIRASELLGRPLREFAEEVA